MPNLDWLCRTLISSRIRTNRIRFAENDVHMTSACFPTRIAAFCEVVIGKGYAPIVFLPEWIRAPISAWAPLLPELLYEHVALPVVSEAEKSPSFFWRNDPPDFLI